MSTKVIDIPLICQGQEISIPLENIKNNDPDNPVNNVIISVVVPDGVEFVSANLPRGTYNSVSGVWDIGTMAAGETLFGELIYKVTNDCLVPFKFTYQAGATTPDVCNIADGQGGCVLIQGLTCCEFTEKCEDNMAIDIFYTVPKETPYSFNCTEGDNFCTSGSPRTFKWIELPGNGQVSGDPNNAIYTPDDQFCGVDKAVYGLYCNDVLQDTATVIFNVTCGLAVADVYETDIDTPLNALTSENDFSCINGGDTRYILSSNEAADSGGLSEPTSDVDVTVTAWSQVDGGFTVTPTNGFVGVVTFNYFVRCIDPVTGIFWDSNPVPVTIGIPDIDVPASSSAVASSSLPAPSSSFPPASSSNPASSNPVPSSSNVPAASSSAIASSSNVAASSSAIVSSSNVVSSSNPPAASSSATPVSSDLPDSSDVASSSNVPAPSSSAPDSSSNVAASSPKSPSSSAVVSSSNPPDPSSSATASSSPVASSSEFIPSSNPAASSTGAAASSSPAPASSSNRPASSSNGILPGVSSSADNRASSTGAGPGASSSETIP